MTYAHMPSSCLYDQRKEVYVSDIHCIYCFSSMTQGSSALDIVDSEVGHECSLRFMKDM